MNNPTPLSPAAQAVMDGLWDANLDGCESIEDIRRRQAAAALRVAADQVVPEVVNAVGDEHDEARQDQWLCIRCKFLAIAAELEGAR